MTFTKLPQMTSKVTSKELREMQASLHYSNSSRASMSRISLFKKNMMNVLKTTDAIVFLIRKETAEKII